MTTRTSQYVQAIADRTGDSLSLQFDNTDHRSRTRYRAMKSTRSEESQIGALSTRAARRLVCVANSTVHGCGVFAKQNLRKGTFICPVRFSSSPVWIGRGGSRAATANQNGSMTIKFREQHQLSVQEPRIGYVVNQWNFIIREGQFASKLNHACHRCNVTLDLHWVSCTTTDELRMVVVVRAVKDILVGDELLLNYTVMIGHSPFDPCQCPDCYT